MQSLRCRYLIHLTFRASTSREHVKKREKGCGGGVSATSPMLKLAKSMEKIRKPIGVDRIAYLWGVFRLYLNFFFIFGKIILLCWR